ncbi:MAG: hypothetical protein Q9206_000683 [Seirophora lacunosa]
MVLPWCLFWSHQSYWADFSLKRIKIEAKAPEKDAFPGSPIDEQREHNLAERSRLRIAELYSKGLVLEMVWLIAHANHHAWQVNDLFEAAMFGSILDGGTLAGKLDRQEEG